MKGRLVNALRLWAVRWPHLAFLLARRFAWLLAPFNRGISEERLAAVFPELAPRALKAARRRSWGNFVQSEALSASLQHADIRPADPEILPNPGLEELRPPLILASFHIGLFPALGAVLMRLPGEVLVVHQGRFAPRPGVKLVLRGDDEWDRAAAFHHAVAGLRSGGFVFTTLDGGYRDGAYEAGAVEVPMLGGTISLARGGFALARITRTPIVPLVARRSDGGVEIVCGQPIPPADEEETMAAAAARWLGEYLSEFPGEISRRTLQILQPPPGG